MGGLRRRWSLTGSPLSSALARWTQPGFVKSVQRNTITMTTQTSNTAALTTAVDVSNSLIYWLGATSDDTGTTTDVATTRVALTNGTTVTATCGSASGTQIVSFEVVEYYPGVLKYVQRGTIVPGTPVTITNPVNMAKARLDYLGGVASGSTTNATCRARIVLTNGTTITATEVTGTNVTIGYQVAEFY